MQVSKRIPNVPELEIRQLSKSIQALIRRDGNLWQIKQPGLYDSFIWQPKITTKAPTTIVIARVKTYHTLNHQGAFKASIAEVLSQIPKDLLPKTDAFEVSNLQQKVINGKYRAATTILYAYA